MVLTEARTVMVLLIHLDDWTTTIYLLIGPPASVSVLLLVRLLLVLTMGNSDCGFCPQTVVVSYHSIFYSILLCALLYDSLLQLLSAVYGFKEVRTSERDVGTPQTRLLSVVWRISYLVHYFEQ